MRELVVIVGAICCGACASVEASISAGRLDEACRIANADGDPWGRDRFDEQHRLNTAVRDRTTLRMRSWSLREVEAWLGEPLGADASLPIAELTLTVQPGMRRCCCHLGHS